MFLARGIWLSAMLSALIFLNGCRTSGTSGSDKLSNVKIEPHIQKDDDLPTVVFDLKPSAASPADAGYHLYECAYQAQGKIARFRLKFKQGPYTSDEIPVARGEGKFLSVKGSDNSVLLQALRKALDAKTVPEHSPRVGELAFDAVVLGDHQSQAASGGFSATPAGDWMTIKIFLPKGGDDGEVFLNLNPVLGKGEFALKDSDYGDYLLKEFAKIL
jgi:hypothetical protein